MVCHHFMISGGPNSGTPTDPENESALARKSFQSFQHSSALATHCAGELQHSSIQVSGANCSSPHRWGARSAAVQVKTVAT